MRRLFLPLLTVTLAMLTAACSKPEPVVPKGPPEKPADRPEASVAPEEVPAPAKELVAQKDDPEREEQPQPELGGSTESAKLVLNPLGHVGIIEGVFFTPDGKQLVTVGRDATVQLWDVAGGQRLKVLRLPVRPLVGTDLGSGDRLFPGDSCSLSPDGQTLAYCPYLPSGAKELPGRHVILVNLHDGRLLRLRDREQLQGRYHALAFSRDGDRLAASRHGKGNIVVLLWEGLKGVWEKKPEEAGKLKGRPITLEGNRDLFGICSLVFSPDGQRIALGRAASPPMKTVYMQDVPVGAARPGKPVPLGGWQMTVRALAWSPDGQQVAIAPVKDLGGPTNLVVRPIAGGQPLHQLPLHPVSNRDAYGLHFLNDKEILFTWSQDAKDKQPAGHGQSILTLDNPVTERKGPFRPSGEKDLACPSAVSADGKLAAFAAGINRNEIVIWEIATGKPLHPSPLGSQGRTPQSVGWSKDGRLLGFDAFEDNKTPFFRTALDLRELALRAEPVGRSDYLYRYRDNGEWSGHYYPKKRSMELKQGDKVVMQQLGADFALTLSPAREPKWAAWREGRFVTLFDLTANKQVTRLEPSSSVYDLAPSPDGRHLLSANNSQVMYLYRIAADPAQTERAPLLYLYVFQDEWVMWTKEGYYAASPNGEKLMGWTVDNGPERLSTFHPAQRFRQHFYRPELIKLVLEKGSVAEALKAGNARAEELDQFLPPQGTLRIVKQDGVRVEVSATADAHAKGQRVSELHLLVDGRPAQLANGQVAVQAFTPGAQKNIKESWTVNLEPGHHKLSVRAVAKDTYSISEEVSVEVKAPMALPRTNKLGTLYYLGIGVNQFQKHPELKLTGAVPDVEAMEKCLKETCKDRYEIKPTVLTDDKATLEAIDKALTGLLAKLKPTDVAIVHFSSHGEVEQGENGGLYLLCHDSKRNDLKRTVVPGEKLREVLGQYPCPVLLILDACHSGKIPLKSPLRSVTDPLSRLLADDSCGVAVMCAALAHQKAIDTDKGGVFTQALVEGLAGKADPDKFSKRLYVHNLFMYVYGSVANQTENKQMPLYLPSGSVPPIVLKEESRR